MKETEEEFIMVRDITKEASNYQRFCLVSIVIDWILRS